MATGPQGKILAIIGLVVVFGVVGYYTLSAPDQRSAEQNIADAAKDAGNDLKKAANQQ